MAEYHEPEQSSGFEIMIKMFADLGDRADRNSDRLANGLGGLRRAKPVRKPAGVSVYSTAAPQLLQNALSPAAGRAWAIRRIVLIGSDGHTLVPDAVADVYAGPGTDPDIQAQFLSGVTVPFTEVWGGDRIWVNSRSQIYAWVYGYTAPQLLSLVAWVDEYRQDDVEAMRI